MAQLTSIQGSTNGNSATNFDRKDPDTARKIFEKLLPVEQTRTDVLRLLADLIHVTNEGPDKWGVTLHSSEVALNVGGGANVYAFKLGYQGLYLVWMQDATLPLEGEEQAYHDYPDTRKKTLLPTEWISLLPKYQPFIEQFITYMDSKSQTPLTINSRKAHSPGVLRYLEQELGIHLPDPSYMNIEDDTNNKTSVNGKLPTRNYWAFQYNPKRYDLPKAMTQLKEDSWSTGGSDIQPGDRALFWQAKGGGDKRGIVCLAEITAPSAVIKPLHPEFFIKSEDVPAMSRTIFRYVPCSELPLWFDDLPEPLRKMSVVTGQGSAFKVTPEQWEILMDTIGGWPEDDKMQGQSPEVMLQEFPLNTILYGPPGTGKTYETAKRAVEIIDGTAPNLRSELMDRYRELQRLGRIGFVTFHQSYSYEDFVEGIRPVVSDDATGATTPRYHIADGILKDLSLSALGASLRLILHSTESGPSFAALWQAFIEKIEDDPEMTIPGISPDSEYRLSVTEKGTLRGENIKGNAQSLYTASRKNIEKAWIELPPTVKPTHNKLKGIIKVGSHTNLIGAVLLQLRELAKEIPIGTPTPEPLAREKAIAFLEGSGNDLELLQAAPRYILIVDEINRGNVSKILGELITLLEDDKRVGKDNQLTVTLPYSREPFSLPSNLYLIGTMNTADKSLALLDIALRRRFDFQELTPDFSKCNPPLAPAMSAALNELNRRITLRKDRDHRIGHAFFMNVGDDVTKFDNVFRRKIIPLLQEYFFNDWTGVMYALGEPKEGGGFIREIPGAENEGTRNRWQWFSDAETKSVFSSYSQLIKNYKLVNNSDESIQAVEADEEDDTDAT